MRRGKLRVHPQRRHQSSELSEVYVVLPPPTSRDHLASLRLLASPPLSPTLRRRHSVLGPPLQQRGRTRGLGVDRVLAPILRLHLLLDKVDVARNLAQRLMELGQELCVQIVDASEQLRSDADYDVAVLLGKLEGGEGVRVVEEALDVLVRENEPAGR